VAKNKNKSEAPASKKNVKTLTTGARKGRKVLQSNGLHYFKAWAEKPAPNRRGAFRMEHPKLYRELVAKGEALDRRMDRPPVPKDQPQESEA
jgi:hypothetical protein